MSHSTAAWQSAPDTRHSVVLEILLHGPLARSELARRLDLSPASLTRLTRPLLDSGLVVEGGDTHAAHSGRPTRPLDVVSTCRHFVGIKLTGDDAHAVATTLRAEVVARRCARLTSREPAAVVETLASLAADVGSGLPGLSGLGVCLGGLVDEHRVIVRAPFLEWTRPVELARLLEDAVGLPTIVDNDVLALTRAEQWFGAARGIDHFAVVTIGAGVGCGLVVHDMLVESPDAGLGLVGHFPLDPLGPVCFVGHRGCASAMLTIPGIEARVSVALRRRVSYDQCLDLARDGQAAAVEVVTASARALGRLIAAVANLTMARRIIVTGDGVRLAVLAHDTMVEAARADRDPYADPLEIETQLAGFDEWARGAAAAAIQTHVLGLPSTRQTLVSRLANSNGSRT